MSDEAMHEHRFRLVAVRGTSEQWNCAIEGCDETRVDGPSAKCRRCGGYRTEPAPWWCGTREAHAAPAQPKGEPR